MEDLWGEESEDLLLNEAAETIERNENRIDSDGDDLMLSQSLAQTERSQQKCVKEQSGKSNLRNSNNNKQSKTSQGRIGQLDEMMSSSVKTASKQNTNDMQKLSSVDRNNESNSQHAQSNPAAGPSQETEAELRKQKKSLEQVKNTFDSELQCSICNELFIQATSLNCAHAFCALCINQWMRTSQACPMCRTTVTSRTRSLVLDNFIEKMCEHFGDDMKEDRRSLLESRKLEQARYEMSIRIAPPLPRSPSSPIIVEVVDRSPSTLSSSSDLPPVRDRSPLSPFYVSSDYSGSFIDDSDLSMSSFSDSGDSLYTTDSSATDFSDHSPRSRQRRRETRHRDRRSRRQHRRNRNTDSDSSMSHGRRIDWRRRQRTGERRWRNLIWDQDQVIESSSQESEVDASPERGRRSRRSPDGRRREESVDSMYEDSPERGSRHRRRRVESSDSDVVDLPERVSRRQRRRLESSDSRDDSPERESYRSSRLETSESLLEDSPEVQSHGRRGRRRLESDSEDSDQERDNRRERTRERERNRQERQRDREERRRDREERNRDREERNRDREVRRRERRDRRQDRRRRSNRDERRDREGEMSSDENFVRDNRRDSGHRRERSRSGRTERTSARTDNRRTSRRNVNSNNNFNERSTSSTTSYTPTSRVFYGGYGKCFRCGRSGHWANGCPTR